MPSAGDRPRPAIQCGPKTTLFTGAGEGRLGWSYIQPDAANIKEVRDHVASVIEDMQRLGMQPTIARSGDVSATESAISASKAHSALQSWSLNLKDTLERLLEMTHQWMDDADSGSIVVNVHTDFGVGAEATAEANVITTAERQGMISKRTARDELQRRGILGPTVRAGRRGRTDRRRSDRRLSRKN